MSKFASTHRAPTLILAIAAVTLTAVACGSTAPATARVSAPVSASASPSIDSQAPTPSLSAPALVYSGQLTFSGGVSGKFTVQAPSSGASSACGDGSIDVGVSIKGQVWDIDASASPFKGPGKYAADSNFQLLISTPTFDLWTATGGTVTYSSDRAASLNVSITNMMAGPGEPGANAHISGMLSCG